MKPSPCIIITAERAQSAAEWSSGRSNTNAERTAALRRVLAQSPYIFREASGYAGARHERSFVIYGSGGAFRDFANQLRVDFDQESYLYVTASRRAYLVRGPGFSKEYQGKLIGAPQAPLPGTPFTFVHALSTFYLTVKRPAPHRTGGTVCR